MRVPFYKNNEPVMYLEVSDPPPPMWRVNLVAPLEQPLRLVVEREPDDDLRKRLQYTTGWDLARADAKDLDHVADRLGLKRRCKEAPPQVVQHVIDTYRRIVEWHLNGTQQAFRYEYEAPF